MLAALALTLKGTPFLYQGQEIGMLNFDFSRMRQLNDACSSGPIWSLPLSSLQNHRFPGVQLPVKALSPIVALGGGAYVAVFAASYILWDIFYGVNDIAYWTQLPALSVDQRQRESMKLVVVQYPIINSAMLTVVHIS